MRESNLHLSLFVSGIILIFATLPLYLALGLRQSAVDRVDAGLAKGERIFVTIARAQKKENLLGNASYFFAYTGSYRGARLKIVEEVDPQLFHLYSEGKNLEALAFEDGAGVIHSRLRANQDRPAKDFGDLRLAIFIVAGLGTLLALAGLGLRSRRETIMTERAPANGDGPPRRVLIAPDKFKGTLSAPEAARAMAAGLKEFAEANGQVVPEIILRPLADGGEGSHDVLSELPEMQARSMECTRAGHGRGPAPFLMSETRTAGAPETEKPALTRHYYLETARIIGLQSEDNRAPNIIDRTTIGIGEWIASLTAANLRKPDSSGASVDVVFHLFLGGSATSDGGFGLARGLGFRFFDDNDDPIETFREADRLKTILVPDPSIFDPKIELRVYTDVASPLLGPDGAAHLFGPQKGATAEEVPLLEERIRRLQAALTVATGIIETDPPGLGAAGGLSLPLFHWPRGQAKILPGIDFFLETTGIDELLASGTIDLALTGEGAADRGTLQGKVAAGLARRCQEAGVPLGLFAGVIRAEDRLSLERAAEFALVRDTATYCDDLGRLPTTGEAAERLTLTVARGLEGLRPGN